MPGFHPIRLIRKALARAPPVIRQPDATDLKAVNVAFVAAIKAVNAARSPVAARASMLCSAPTRAA